MKMNLFLKLQYLDCLLHDFIFPLTIILFSIDSSKYICTRIDKIYNIKV